MAAGDRCYVDQDVIGKYPGLEKEFDFSAFAPPNVNIEANTLFAFPPTPTGPPPANSVGDFLNQSGRIEVIWFPPLPSNPGDPVPTTYPWLKV